MTASPWQIPYLKGYEPPSNEFKAYGVSTSEYLNPELYSNVSVQIDGAAKRIVLKIPNNSKLNQYHQTNFTSITINWDTIKGIDFQCTPRKPVAIALELSQIPINAPLHFASKMYFIYVSKRLRTSL